jgi:peptidoglycan/LPS O-acetylase OafA/YrhL
LSNEGLLIAATQMVLGLALFGWKVSTNIMSSLSFFGSISYGIYVFHMPVMNFMHRFSTFSGSPISFMVRVLIWIVLTIGTSYILELKMQPIAKRWFQQKVINHV